MSSPEATDPGDAATRFITESGHFSKTHVKPKAFEPKFDLTRRRSETPVFRTDGLPQRDIWTIGATHVVPGRGKPVLARARLLTASISGTGLQLVDDAPPERHAVIVGWPEGPEEKSSRLSLQQDLAANAVLTLAPQCLS